MAEVLLETLLHRKAACSSLLKESFYLPSWFVVSGDPIFESVLVAAQVYVHTLGSCTVHQQYRTQPRLCTMHDMITLHLS